MKRSLLTLALVIAIAAASYAVTRHFVPLPQEDHSAWLQREFKLTAAQLAAVEKLQADYEPVCAEHCAQVMAARHRLEATPADPALLAEVENLKRVCFEATTQHLRAVAALMDPAQGRRFLALMEPKVTGHDQPKPLGLK